MSFRDKAIEDLVYRVHEQDREVIRLALQTTSATPSNEFMISVNYLKKFILEFFKRIYGIKKTRRDYVVLLSGRDGYYFHLLLMAQRREHHYYAGLNRSTANTKRTRDYLNKIYIATNTPVLFVDTGFAGSIFDDTRLGNLQNGTKCILMSANNACRALKGKGHHDWCHPVRTKILVMEDSNKPYYYDFDTRDDLFTLPALGSPFHREEFKSSITAYEQMFVDAMYLVQQLS